MKKLSALLSLLLSLLLLAFLTSCSKETLPMPVGISLDEELELRWSTVDGARAYTVEANAVDEGNESLSKTTRKTHLSLKELAVGDYEVRVMATGGKQNDEISPWSEILYFHRDYETGCVYLSANNNTEFSIQRAGSANGVVYIEDTYRGKPVTAILDKAFNGNRNIVDVRLGNNIRTIGEAAFYGCSVLERISIPETLTSLGTSAFHGCRALTAIELPDAVTEIPDACFYTCRALSSVKLGDHVRSIGQMAFGSTALTTFTIPDTVETVGENAFSSNTALTSIHIGAGVRALGDRALAENTALTTVTFAENAVVSSFGLNCFSNDPLLSGIILPSSLTDIGKNCFAKDLAITEIDLPDGIEHIGAGAFNGTGLYEATEGDFVYADNWLVHVRNVDTYRKIEKTDFREGTVGLADDAFCEASLLETVVLPDSIVYLGDYAFYYCPLLWKIEMGTGLRKIGAHAFTYCGVLTRALMKRGLESIGSFAFYGCKLLDNNAIEGNTLIPDTVTHIGEQAFVDTKLYALPDEYGIVYAGDWVVGYAKNATLGAVVLKAGLTGVADYAFYNADTLQTVQHLSDCKYIGEGAFYGCTALAAVTLNVNLRKIEPVTFFYCQSLYQVSFPRQLTSIGEAAFLHCDLLESIDLSTARNLELIDDLAFYRCGNLTEINFGETLTAIGEKAFYGSNALAAIHLPDSVESIGSYAFANTGASSLRLPDGITEIRDHAFFRAAKLGALDLPDSVEKIGEKAFYGTESLASVTFGKGLSSIGEYAFTNNRALTRLAFPENLSSIGVYAFANCAVLKEAILPSSVEKIASNAFYACPRVTFYLLSDKDGENWNKRWNSSNRPVIRGVVLSDEGCVDGVTVGENTFANFVSLIDDKSPVAAPLRDDYYCHGWTDGTAVYVARDLASLPVGTKLSVVWSTEKPSSDVDISEEDENEGWTVIDA